MEQLVDNSNARLFPVRLAVVIVAVLVFGLLVAAPALAGYEQVGTFAGTPGVLKPGLSSERWPEDVKLGGVGGMAVNVSGAGGVPAGTVYAAIKGSVGGRRVARFNPGGEFVEAWTFNGSPPDERCGPEGDPAHPVCENEDTLQDERTRIDVGVDQRTGDVYVYDGEDDTAGDKLIHVYSPDGSTLISEFGERAVSGEATAAAPEKLHEPAQSEFGGGLAVDSSGDVYVFDVNKSAADGYGTYDRLMVFEPQSPGDYAHYVYAGQNHDIRAGLEAGEPNWPTMPAVGPAGDVYVASEVSVSVLDPSQPSAGPVCEFKFPVGGIDSMTVNPENGEVFFHTWKEKNIHQLGPCNARGEFTETAVFGVTPRRLYVGGLVFDPAGQFGPGRPPGVLYAGAPDGAGGTEEKIGPGEFKGESSMGYIFARPVEALPVVESESVAHATASAAELGALINPEGSATRYVFQYITEAAFEENTPAERFAGASEAPLGGALLGEGRKALNAVVSLSGLAPDTPYRYRVIATSECSVSEPGKICETTGPVQSFRTFPMQAPGLPDHRGYELVSPADKHGGQVLPADPRIKSCSNACKPINEGGVMLSAPDGDTVVYPGTPFSSGEGGVLTNEYIARRVAGTGWQTTNLTPSQLYTKGGNGYEAFSTGLTEGLIFQTNPVLSPEAPLGYQNLYTQSTTDPGELSSLLNTAPEHRPASGAGQFEINYGGASGDLSHVFFEANDGLTGASAFAPKALDGGPGKRNLYESNEGQLRLVNVKPGNTETEPGAAFGSTNPSAHAISENGLRVFWSSGTGQVYVREDGERTREIPDHTGRFLSASADGSRVLLSDGQLYDLQSETIIDLTQDLTQGQGGFQGLVGRSEDLSHIYFVDTAVLDETPNEHGEAAKTGQDNLYEWHEGGSVRFVATLLATDNTEIYGLGNDWAVSPSNRTAEASPDGGWVAFVSKARLTGYDNTGPCAENSCPEVFLYNVGTGRLVCASCNPSGARPAGWSVLRLIDRPGSPSLPQSRYLSDQGRLFFDSQDALVPADTNGKVEDVYEYEPVGVGTCERQGGCVFLISAGTGSLDSNFVAMDSSGANVFFTTTDRLVSSDRDDLIDLYDARENGGEATVSESRGCQGETCQGASPPPPVEPVPGSFLFTGVGNPLTAPTPGMTVAKAKVRALTRAQKLTGALKACRRKPKRQRASCERTTRRRYGARTSTKRSVNNRTGGGR
jgi:hypothetical protein